MPKGHPTNTTMLLRELASALKEVDDLKADLRKAKSRVTALMNKLNIRVDSSRIRRKRNLPSA